MVTSSRSTWFSRPTPSALTGVGSTGGWSRTAMLASYRAVVGSPLWQTTMKSPGHLCPRPGSDEGRRRAIASGRGVVPGSWLWYGTSRARTTLGKSSLPDRPTEPTVDDDGNTRGWRHQGPFAGEGGGVADRVGGAGDAGAAHDPGAVSAGAAAGRAAGVGVPARDLGDGEPDADAAGRGGGAGAVRLQPAVDQRRGGGGAGGGARDPDLRDQGGRRADLLPAHRGGVGAAAAPDHGRWGGPGDDAAPGAG